jgi:hypothetical protein
MEIGKALIFGFILIITAFACEGIVVDAIRNAGLTGIAADLLSGSFITYALVRLSKGN